MTSEFKPTGAPDVREAVSYDMREPKDRLRDMVATEVRSKPFSELFTVSLDHEGAQLAGHVLLDTLEEQGYGLDDFDAVGALTAAAVPFACAMVHAAASRGQDLDAFVMDFVYPSIKGPSIDGKRVVLLDSWLSEKSYVQTSSLVTLRHGNELGLDFSIVTSRGAQVVAIASLVGGVKDQANVKEQATKNAAAQQVQPTIGEPTRTIDVVDPVNDKHTELPFIEVFDEYALRDGNQADTGIAASTADVDTTESSHTDPNHADPDTTEAA